jgi:predicted anti-sigma-YlaC factor YlaD
MYWDHILQEFYTLFLTRFRTYKIASPPQTKMTSKDDIKGLVSLKLLCPCCCSSAIYTIEAEDQRVDPHRRLDQLSKRRRARGHDWFYDGSLLATTG